MKKFLFIISILIVITLITLAMKKAPPEVESLGPKVIPIEHATFVLDWDGQTIYNDPVGEPAKFAGIKPADLVLISDIHGDHFSLETLKKVVGINTSIVAPKVVAEELTPELLSLTAVLENDKLLLMKGFTIETKPMYNLPESPEAFHVRGRGNGYVVAKDGFRVYIAGDTEDTLEMRSLRDIDLAFIPMNLPYTMDIEAAASTVLEFKPKKVIPYHYRGKEGLSDVAKFKELVERGGDSGIVVELLEWYPQKEASAQE